MSATNEQVLRRLVEMELTEYETEYLIGALVSVAPSAVTVILNDIERKRTGKTQL